MVSSLFMLDCVDVFLLHLCVERKMQQNECLLTMACMKMINP